jgi:hypothetical protein
MQFENEFARSWHVRRKEAVATLDACEMDIRRHAPPQRRWCTRILQKNARAKIFRFLPVGIKTMRENGPTFRKKPKQLAARNNADKKEMRRKERQIETLKAQILGLRTTRDRPTRFCIIGTLRLLLLPALAC